MDGVGEWMTEQRQRLTSVDDVSGSDQDLLQNLSKAKVRYDYRMSSLFLVNVSGCMINSHHYQQ